MSTRQRTDACESIQMIHSFDWRFIHSNRKNSKTMAASSDREDKTSAASSTTAFQEHAQEDVALARNDDTQREASSSGPGLTVFGKIAVFLGFPLVIGVLGLYLAYLERLNKPKELSFERDFVTPFLLAFAMAVVVSIQTNGFRERKARGIVRWPQVKRVKKVIHKKGGKVVPAPSEKDTTTKKDD